MVIPSSPDSAIREEPPPAFCRTNPSPEPSPLVVRRLNHSTLAVSSEWGTPLNPADRLQCNPTPEGVPQDFAASVLGTIEPLRQPVSAKQTSGAPGVDAACPINLLLSVPKDSVNRSARTAPDAPTPSWTDGSMPNQLGSFLPRTDMCLPLWSNGVSGALRSGWRTCDAVKDQSLAGHADSGYGVCTPSAFTNPLVLLSEPCGPPSSPHCLFPPKIWQAVFRNASVGTETFQDRQFFNPNQSASPDASDAQTSVRSGLMSLVITKDLPESPAPGRSSPPRSPNYPSALHRAVCSG